MHNNTLKLPSSKKQACIVVGCPELIAPTMRRAHLSLHVRGVFPGTIPPSWLEERGMFVCGSCCQIVSESHASSHQSKCSGNCAPQNTIGHVTNTTSVQHDATVLPSLEDIFCLKVQTLRHIPSYALPAFALALSAALRCVLHENTLEAWIKLLLLPKCCLPSAKRRGRHHKPINITMLCDLWSRGQFGVLWRLAQGHSKLASTTKNNDRSHFTHDLSTQYLLQGMAYIQKHARF